MVPIVLQAVSLLSPGETAHTVENASSKRFHRGESERQRGGRLKLQTWKRPHDFEVILWCQSLDLLKVGRTCDLLKDFLEACWGNNNQYFG